MIWLAFRGCLRRGMSLAELVGYEVKNVASSVVHTQYDDSVL
jgi:hypothetical protein